MTPIWRASSRIRSSPKRTWRRRSRGFRPRRRSPEAIERRRARPLGVWQTAVPMAATNKAITPELSVERLAGTFPGDLGIELTKITDEHVRGRMLVDRRHLHPMGYVHAGAWTAFADTIAAWGTMRHLTEGRGFTT